MAEQPRISSLSVIIPTYNRQLVLAKALAGYLAQRSQQFIREVLVIDDGSTDDTEAMVRDFGSRAAFPVRYFRQSNQGPAAARNLGIDQAQSELVLFTDSDVIPKNDLVEEHIASHRRNPEPNAAVQGYLAWVPTLNATPFMRWYGDHKLFNFSSTDLKTEIDYSFFYTCNVSLKTEFLRTCGRFDEEFKSAAYEDTELAYRLGRHGMRLFYNSEAIGYHDQFFSFEDACRKANATSSAMQLFFQKEAGCIVLNGLERKRSQFRYKVGTHLARSAVRVLSPLVRCRLDSSSPLPGILYRLFFWASTRQTRQRAVEAAIGVRRKLEL